MCKALAGQGNAGWLAGKKKQRCACWEQGTALAEMHDNLGPSMGSASRPASTKAVAPVSWLSRGVTPAPVANHEQRFHPLFLLCSSTLTTSLKQPASLYAPPTTNSPAAAASSCGRS